MDPVLSDDLVLAAGHVATHALNEFPESIRPQIAKAMASGFDLEVRVALGTPRLVAVWLRHNTDEIEKLLAVLQE